MPEIYADSIEAKVDGTNQIVPIRDITKAPAIIASASGESIELSDSAYAPLTDMRLYGRSSQVTTTGAQLLNIPDDYAGENNGVTWVANGGVIHVSGTPTSAVFTTSINITDVFKEGETYYVSGNIGSDATVYAEIKYNDDTPNDYIQNGVYVAKPNIKEAIFYVNVAAGKPVDFDVKPMINKGSTALPWEPYTGGKPSPSPDNPQEIHSAGYSGTINVTLSDGGSQSQTLPVSTPNGLPGIPVTSGGNYTGENDQQWISDIYDAIVGEYYRYTATIESYNGEIITTPYISTTGELTTGAKVIYALETPTVESAESFTTNSYYPNTNITTDDAVQPGMEVDYVTDTKTWIENKLTEIQTQLLNMQA